MPAFIVVDLRGSENLMRLFGHKEERVEAAKPSYRYQGAIQGYADAGVLTRTSAQDTASAENRRKHVEAYSLHR